MADGCIYEPKGVAVSPDGSMVYIADISNKRVSAFTSDAKFSHHVGKFGKQRHNRMHKRERETDTQRERTVFKESFLSSLWKAW